MSVLLRRWPFDGNGSPSERIPADEVQRVAQLFVNGKLQWNEAHFEMADAYLKKDDLASAIKEFEAVHALDPYDPFPLMRTGDLYSLLRNDKKAEQAYRDLIALREDPVARLKLGVTYLKLEQPEAALKQILTALEVNDRSRVHLTGEQYENALFYEALAFYRLGKGEDAVRLLATLLRSDPGNARASRLSKEIQNALKK